MTTPTTPAPAPFGQPGGHPSYRENADKCPTHTYRKGTAVNVEPCSYCGRPIVGAPKFTVFLTTGERFESREVAAECLANPGVMDWLGHYPIGSDCARKLKAAGVAVFKAP